MRHNVVIPKITNDEGDYDSDVMEVDSDGNTDKTKTDGAAKGEESGKNDWMIPIEFQSDMSHIHLKAGFTQIGL